MLTPAGYGRTERSLAGATTAWARPRRPMAASSPSAPAAFTPAASEARAARSERREVLDDVQTITAYAEEMREFLGTSEITESKTFIHSFVKEIAVAPGAATIRYTIPMPGDSPLRGGKAEEVALGGSVLCTVKFGRIWWA